MFQKVSCYNIFMIKIISDYGFCYGVENAIAILKETSRKNNSVYLSHPLIHNKLENSKLINDFHVNFYDSTSELNKNDVVVLSAHGHSKEEEKELIAKTNIVDATCPLILKRNSTIPKYDESTSFYYLGKEHHQETIGFLSNFKYFTLIDSTKDIQNQIDLNKIKTKSVLVPQTTVSNSKYLEAKEIIEQHSALTFTLPICKLYSTRAEQAIASLKNIDINNSYLIVCGDISSSNANEIFNTIISAYKNLDGAIVLEANQLDLTKIKNKDIYITSATSVSKTTVEKLFKDLENLKF